MMIVKMGMGIGMRMNAESTPFCAYWMSAM